MCLFLASGCSEETLFLRCILTRIFLCAVAFPFLCCCVFCNVFGTHFPFVCLFYSVPATYVGMCFHALFVLIFCDFLLCFCLVCCFELLFEMCSGCVFSCCVAFLVCSCLCFCVFVHCILRLLLCFLYFIVFSLVCGGCHVVCFVFLILFCFFWYSGLVVYTE